MKKIVWNLLFGFCYLGLSACGGGGGGDTAPSPTPPTASTPTTGIFVDSAIENIRYRTLTQSGYTNALGEFKYVAGETVTFSIGEIDLPAVTAAAKITPLDLANSSSNPSGSNAADVLANLLVLLQSLDADQNPTNGIKLTEESKSLSKAGFSIYLSPSAFSSSNTSGSLRALIAASKVKDPTGALATAPVSLELAQAHFAVANASIKAVALASSSGTPVVGNTLTLNGSASYDAQGKTLASFAWSVSAIPAYSRAVIKNPSSPMASLSIDVAGDYGVQLTVKNSLGLSSTTAFTVKGAPHPKFGASILTMYATRTGVDLSCNGGEDAISCDNRLRVLIHTEKLGCVTCDATQADSICNVNGEYGSLSGTQSIWNTDTNRYGNPANQSSPWNSALIGADQGKILRITPLLYTQFPDVVDERVIAFTLNADNYFLGDYLPDPVKEPLLQEMLAAYTGAGASASAKRDAVCSALSQAMQ